MHSRRLNVYEVQLLAEAANTARKEDEEALTHHENPLTDYQFAEIMAGYINSQGFRLISDGISIDD